MKINEVIKRIVEYHPPLNSDRPTCDTVKCGDPEQECTGIVVCCFPSVEVIRQAVKLGANMIIAHEPLFWSNEEDNTWLEKSPVYQEKKRLLEESGIVIWRDHDHIHGGNPFNPPLDGIFDGIMKELEWEPYLIGSSNKPLLFQIPETDATELGQELERKLNLKGIRISGDPHARVSKVFFWEHIRENDRHGEEKLLKVDQENIDAVIPLEIIDWTVCAYVRDASQLGFPKIVYNIGHFNLEELGMKHMLSYLPDILGTIPITYVPSGDSFDFIL